MDERQALDGFAALSQETRLRIVRMLVKAGAEGMSAGAIAAELDGSAASRVSFHLGHLENAKLITKRRNGRSIIYSAIFPQLSDLVAFLMRDCCQGHCKVCDQAITLFAQCTGRPTEPQTSKLALGRT
ncbi:ArsR/SmtB family transcription factor [Muricoccus roseus]|nr:metalloregulator ArsR/SmtB family transcription factor [Roseomonas rosea]